MYRFRNSGFGDADPLVSFVASYPSVSVLQLASALPTATASGIVIDPFSAIQEAMITILAQQYLNVPMDQISTIVTSGGNAITLSAAESAVSALGNTPSVGGESPARNYASSPLSEYSNGVYLASSPVFSTPSTQVTPTVTVWPSNSPADVTTGNGSQVLPGPAQINPQIPAASNTIAPGPAVPAASATAIPILDTSTGNVLPPSAGQTTAVPAVPSSAPAGAPSPTPSTGATASFSLCFPGDPSGPISSSVPVCTYTAIGAAIILAFFFMKK